MLKTEGMLFQRFKMTKKKIVFGRYSRPPVEIIAKIAKAYASTARDFTARWGGGGGGGGGGLLVSCVPMREQKKNITKTRPCNIQQYFTIVKMFIFR